LVTAWCQDPSALGGQLSPFLRADEQQMAVLFSKTEPVTFPQPVTNTSLDGRGGTSRPSSKDEALHAQHQAFLMERGTQS
jgi:hypothetical protein